MIFVDLFNRKIRHTDVHFQYSEEEKFTGQYWIDGKKIYQRTWVIGAQGGGAVVYIQLNDIDKIWYDMSNSFYIEAGSGNVGNVWPLNGNMGDANANGYQVSGRGPYYVPSNKRLHWQVSSGGCSQAFITIRYTKSTE